MSRRAGSRVTLRVPSRPRGAALLPEPDRRHPEGRGLVAPHRRPLHQQNGPQGLRALVRLGSCCADGTGEGRAAASSAGPQEPGCLRGCGHWLTSEQPVGSGSPSCCWHGVTLCCDLRQTFRTGRRWGPVCPGLGHAHTTLSPAGPRALSGLLVGVAGRGCCRLSGRVWASQALGNGCPGRRARLGADGRLERVPGHHLTALSTPQPPQGAVHRAARDLLQVGQLAARERPQVSVCA